MLGNRPLSFAVIFPNISKHFPGNSQNVGKTSKSSVPVLSAGPLYSLLSTLLAAYGFFAYLANCFGFPARPCTCMLAHAASSSALPCPLVSRLVSRQSRLETLVFPGKQVVLQ
jgi:hypothetical protein